MIINKNSGDDLAVRFNSILNQNIKKYASINKKAEQEVIENSAEDAELSDMLLDQEDHMLDQEHHMEDHMLDQEHHMEDHMLDQENYMSDELQAEAKRIMQGLGKIAGSLKRKGEVFAADVVEATALSIRDDFRKQASASYKTSANKGQVLSELDKMADRLISKGKIKAAKEVLKTANKISKS